MENQLYTGPERRKFPRKETEFKIEYALQDTLFVIDDWEVKKELKIRITKIEFRRERWADGELKCISFDMIEGRDKESLASVKCLPCNYRVHQGPCSPRACVIFKWKNKNFWIEASPTSVYSLRRYLDQLAGKKEKIYEVITKITCEQRYSRTTGTPYWRMKFNLVKSSKK